jgi:hypothetical protein
MPTTSRIVSISNGCKTPDGRHISGDNGRCLICWKLPSAIEEASRVLVITISAEHSERDRVDGLAEIVEAQVRGIFTMVSLIESRANATGKPVELEVCAS